MSNVRMEVTVTGVLRRAEGREEPLAKDEYNKVFEKVSDSLHAQFTDAGVTGNIETGELNMWFLIMGAGSFNEALKRMTKTISKVFRAAGIEAEPAVKRSPVLQPRGGATVMSNYKMVSEPLAA